MINSEILQLQIEPYQRVSTKTIGCIYIAIESIELFKSVSLRITYMDINGVYVETEIIKLNGAEYLAWGNDDTYLYNYISQLKGFTIIPARVAMVTIPAEPPVVETPAEIPAVETPAVETPDVETPAETPAVETPVETPAVETPAEIPAVETPAVETPDVETPAETPAVETPAETPSETPI
jgi:hypothetical protein